MILYDRARARWPRLTEISSFGCVGVLGFVVDAGVLYIGLWLGLGLIFGRLVSYIMAATTTWLVNRNFTFNMVNRPTLKEWATYLAANSMGGLINLAVYLALVTGVNKILPVLAVGIGSICGMMVNYLLSRLVLNYYRDS